MTTLSGGGTGLLSGPVYSPVASGLYVGQPCGTTTNAVTQSLLYASPLFLAKPCTLDRIGAEVTTLAATTNVRLGIYADSNGRPGALLLDAGTIDATGNGAKEVSISLAVPAGLLWVASVAQGGAPTMRANNAPVHGFLFPTLGTALGANPVSSVTQAGVVGALPSTFVVGSNAIREPRVVVRVA